MARWTCCLSYFFAEQKGLIHLKGVIRVGPRTDSAVCQHHQLHTGARPPARRANQAYSNEAAHGAVFALLHAQNHESTHKARPSPLILARTTLGTCLIAKSNIYTMTYSLCLQHISQFCRLTRDACKNPRFKYYRYCCVCCTTCQLKKDAKLSFLYVGAYTFEENLDSP